MKKLNLILLIAVIFCMANNDLSAQKFLNNLKSKVSGKGNNKTVANTDKAEFINIAEKAKKWSSGSYKYFETNGVLTLPSGEKEVVITKDDEGQVSEIKIGDDVYKSDVKADNPIVLAYYKKGGRKLYFNDQGIVVYYYWKGSSHEEFNIIGFLGPKQKPKAALKEVKAYRKAAIEKGNEAKEAYSKQAKAKAEADAAARKEKYSLEGKEVSKIEFINLKVPEIFGHWSGGGFSGKLKGKHISYDLKATLKDGSTISTAESNTGYLSDYEISYDEKAYKSGTLETGWSEDDVLTITAKCNANPSLVIKKDIPIKYNQNISYNRNAAGYSGSPGYSAQSFKIELKQVKHAKTGEDLIKYRITNTSTGDLIDEAKMNCDYTLYFTCKGGPGGVDNGTPKNGGNGGHILLIKDPSVKKLDFEYSVDGGKGGVGKYNSGQNGRTGTFKEKVKAVNF